MNIDFKLNFDFKYGPECRTRRRPRMITIPKHAVIDGNTCRWTSGGEFPQEYTLFFMEKQEAQMEEIKQRLEACEDYLIIHI